MGRAFPAVALCLLSSVWSSGLNPSRAAADGAITDLRALTNAAERRSLGLKAARHAIEAAHAQLGEAQVSPFFQFKGTAGLAWVPDARGTPGYSPDSLNELDRSFGPGLSGGVSGAIPLWTFGKIGAARQAAKSGIRVAELDHSRVRQRLVFDVRRAYYALQLSLDAQQMLSEGLPKLRKAAKQLDERLAEGDEEVEQSERHRLNATLAEVTASESEAKRLEVSSRAALRILSGFTNVQVPDCPLAPVVYEAESLAWYQGRAGDDRPELGMLSAAATARQADLDATTAKYFPDLALALELEALHVPGRVAHEYYRPLTLGAALVARWNLDFWGNSYRERRKENLLLETRAQASQAAEGVQLEVETKYAALQDAQRRLEAWQAAHRDARRWFISAAQGYQIGTVTTKELIDGVKAYFKARFAHIQSIHDHNTSVAALELSTGQQLLSREAWNQRCEVLDEAPAQ